MRCLTLSPPSSKPVAQPSTQEMTQTIISDVAKILFQQRKHNRAMTDLQKDDAGVESTSRAAERIFANTKFFWMNLSKEKHGKMCGKHQFINQKSKSTKEEWANMKEDVRGEQW